MMALTFEITCDRYWKYLNKALPWKLNPLWALEILEQGIAPWNVNPLWALEMLE